MKELIAKALIRQMKSMNEQDEITEYERGGLQGMVEIARNLGFEIFRIRDNKRFVAVIIDGIRYEVK